MYFQINLNIEYNVVLRVNFWTITRRSKSNKTQYYIHLHNIIIDKDDLNSISAQLHDSKI